MMAAFPFIQVYKSLPEITWQIFLKLMQAQRANSTKHSVLIPNKCTNRREKVGKYIEKYSSINKSKFC